MSRLKNKRNPIANAVKFALLAAASVSALSAPPVFAAEKEVEEKVEESKIVVTGSRIKRTEAEPMQPISIIDSGYISDRGYTNAAEAVKDIPGVFAGSSPVIGSNSSANNNGLGQNSIDIFGVGSQRTLTLINGTRFISSNSPVGGSDSAGSQVDVNNIPLSLIDRIEVVKVGGAAIYGADAVAGVVNYILKDDYEGAEFSYDYTDLDGIAGETSFRGLIGGNFGNDKGNTVIAFEHNKTENISMPQVSSLYNNWGSFTPLGTDAVLDANGDPVPGQLRLYPNPRAGILSFSGLATAGDTAITAVGLGAFSDGNFYQFDPAGTGDLFLYDTGINTGNIVWSSGGDGLNLQQTNTAQEGYERYNITSITNYKLTDDINFKFTAFANSSDAANPGFQAAVYNSGIWNGTDGGALTFNTSHPFLNNQARTLLESLLGGVDQDFYYHRGWINLGAREVINESNVRSLNFAFDGEFELGDNLWDWNVAYQEGMSSIFSQREVASDARLWAAMDVGINPTTGEIDCKFNYVADYGENLRATGFGLADSEMILGNPGDCSPLDPFGTVSDAAKDYVMYNFMSKTRMEQEIFTAYISGELAELPSGMISMAAGYEKRKESGQFNSDGTLEISGLSVNDTNGQYTTDDFFVEFSIPLVSEEMDIPLIRSLKTEMSYRSMDNSRSGKDSVWAVGLHYRPIDDLVIRANVSETVRAPAITELFLPRVESSQFGGDPCHNTNLTAGPNPTVRQANCAAEGIPTTFTAESVNASRQGFTGGNQDLRNELAESQNFGIFYNPSWAEGLSLSADWMNIEMADAITSFSLTAIMEACYDSTNYPNEFCDKFTRDPITHQLPPSNAFESGYVNAALREFEAIQYTAEYKDELSQYPLIGSWFPEDAGQLSIKLRSYNQKKNATSNTGFDFTDITGQYDSPDWRSNLIFTYKKGNLTTFLDVDYHGVGDRNVETLDQPLKYIDQNGNPYTTIPSMTTMALGAVYDLTDSVTLRLKINNITDWKPAPKERGVGRWTWGQTLNFGVTARF